MTEVLLYSVFPHEQAHTGSAAAEVCDISGDFPQILNE